MRVNLYKDELQNVWLFGQSVLYTEQPISREEVPEGWYCYDLCGTAADPKRPYEMVDRAGQNFAGSILSNVPLMRGCTQSNRASLIIYLGHRFWNRTGISLGITAWYSVECTIWKTTFSI